MALGLKEWPVPLAGCCQVPLEWMLLWTKGLCITSLSHGFNKTPGKSNLREEHEENADITGTTINS